MGNFNFFGAPTGAARPNEIGAVGTPEFESGVVERTARNLQPMYQQALESSRQNLSSRGLSDSGQAIDTGQKLQENFLGQISQSALGAAQQSAQLQEENRIRAEQRQNAIADRNAQYDFLREQQSNQERIAGQQAFNQLLGGLGGAAGGFLGNALFRGPSNPPPNPYQTGGY